MNRPYGFGGAWMVGGTYYGAAAASWQVGTNPATKSRMSYRDVAGEGGYAYRQWVNGDVSITKAPAGKRVVGRFYSAAKGGSAWAAITAELGRLHGALPARSPAPAPSVMPLPAIIPDAVQVPAVAAPSAAASQVHTEGLARFAPAFVGLTIAGVLVITALVLFSTASGKSQATAGAA